MIIIDLGFSFNYEMCQLCKNQIIVGYMSGYEHDLSPLFRFNSHYVAGFAMPLSLLSKKSKISFATKACILQPTSYPSLRTKQSHS